MLCTLQVMEPEEAAVASHMLTPAAEAEAAVVARMRQQQRSFVPTAAQLASLPLQAGAPGPWSLLCRRPWTLPATQLCRRARCLRAAPGLPLLEPAAHRAAL